MMQLRLEDTPMSCLAEREVKALATVLPETAGGATVQTETLENAAKNAYDVCVVGSGASGAVLAARCVAAGLSVVVIERGRLLSESDTLDDLLENSEMAYARDAKGCWGLTGYPWTTSNVGGGTAFFGAAFYRYRRTDFKISRHVPDADMDVDWPYQYDDLEPYYDSIENIVGVAGDDHQNDSTFPGNSALRLPCVSRSDAGVHIAEAGRSRGMLPFYPPLAIATVPHRGRRACVGDAPCMDRRCPYGAKGDAQTIFLNHITTRSDVAVVAGAIALRFERRRKRCIESVSVLSTETGENRTIRARTFASCANAIQSSAILLRSADSWSPSGLGNDYDLLGRGLCFKLSANVQGLIPSEIIGLNSKSGPRYHGNNGPYATVAFTDHYIDQEFPSGVGGLITEDRLSTPYSMGQEYELARMECILADQPAMSNRVRLSRQKNEFGIPRVVIDYQTHPRDSARLQCLSEQASALLKLAGARYGKLEPTGYQEGSCHLHGGVRGGKSPSTSVCDSDGRLWGVDNVFSADGGFFPYPGGVNPTLTIQAHALRVAGSVIQHVTSR